LLPVFRKHRSDVGSRELKNRKKWRLKETELRGETGMFAPEAHPETMEPLGVRRTLVRFPLWIQALSVVRLA
jgi:hypothetical protein